MTEQPIYLDYQATTPMDDRVFEAMRPFLAEAFGNPHSIQHSHGLAASEAVEAARGALARLIGADAREIVFTSGATESNNLAIIGAARFRQRLGDGVARVLTFAFEHKCVLEAARSLRDEGVEVETLPVTPDGFADLDALKAALQTPASVVSLMAVNNEIGTIQPIAEAARLTRAAGALLHVDAAQAVGKLALDVTADNIDLLSVSGHKMYGPKGVGALFVRRRPRARLLPLIHGGGQERGMRSGTLPAPLIVGLGAAATIAGAEMTEEADRLRGLRDRFLQTLEAAAACYSLNGGMDARIPGNLNIAFDGVSALEMMAAVPDISMAAGSACSSASVEPSYVLEALGLDSAQAGRSLRIGFGRQTTEAEVVRAATLLAAAAKRLSGRKAAAE